MIQVESNRFQLVLLKQLVCDKFSNMSVVDNGQKSLALSQSCILAVECEADAHGGFHYLWGPKFATFPDMTLLHVWAAIIGSAEKSKFGKDVLEDVFAQYSVDIRPLEHLFSFISYKGLACESCLVLLYHAWISLMHKTSIIRLINLIFFTYFLSYFVVVICTLLQQQQNLCLAERSLIFGIWLIAAKV